jgi:hypothetical protein
MLCARIASSRFKEKSGIYELSAWPVDFVAKYRMMCTPTLKVYQMLMLHLCVCVHIFSTRLDSSGTVGKLIHLRQLVQTRIVRSHIKYQYVKTKTGLEVYLYNHPSTCSLKFEKYIERSDNKIKISWIVTSVYMVFDPRILPPQVPES